MIRIHFFFSSIPDKLLPIPTNADIAPWAVSYLCHVIDYQTHFSIHF